MPACLNKVQLIGNLGRDPEIRTMQSGARVVNLSIATSETWTDKHSGERREQVEWHRVVMFGDQRVDIAETYLRKGSKIYVEGSLKTRKWTGRHNEDHFTTEIVLQPFNGKFIMLPITSNGREGTEGNDEPSSPPSRDDLDDDIPF